MKDVNFKLILVPLFMLLTASANAHDPSEHQKKQEKPNCAAMQKMDHRAIDETDVVAMAMMKQCESANLAEQEDDSHHQEEQVTSDAVKQEHSMMRHDH